MKTVLLTGATGFLGSHLLEALLKEGYTAIVLKRSTSNLRRIEHFVSTVTCYDIDRVTLDRAFQENPVDAVIHTACHYGRNSDPLHEVVSTNLLFGMSLLEAAKMHRAKIFLNTDTSLPKFLNGYTLSKKHFSEWLCHQSGDVQAVNLRVEHMYGPGDDDTKFLPWLFKQFDTRVDTLNLTAGEQKRDFVHVSDVVTAYLVALSQHARLDHVSSIDIGSGKLTTIKDVVENVREFYVDQYGPIPTVLKFGVIPYRKGEMMRADIDLSELTALGWRPVVSLAEGIQQLMESRR